MKKGLSLIELIFTIVIIAIVFTVIPKIVLSLNKADSFTIRQDAIFNGISMMRMISKLPWDQNNTNSRDILHTNSKYFDCNMTSFHRIGGFIGGRTCEHNLTTSFKLGSEMTDDIFENDIDDFNIYDKNTTNLSKYGLHVEVKYIDDNISYDYLNKSAKINLYINKNKTQIPVTTNLKYIDINITYQGKRGKKGKQLTQFNYTSANIGQMILNKRSW